MYNFSKHATASSAADRNQTQLGAMPPSEFYPTDATAPEQDPVITSNPDAPPELGADEEVVLTYYRNLVEKHNLAPPKHWRQIRLELPKSVPELHLDPSLPEREQFDTPGPVSSSLVLSLEGLRPEGTTTSEYMVQMVDYVFDLLKYNNAITAVSSLRFVKKGTELSQLVFMLGNDSSLASKMLSQIREAGIRAGFGPPVHEHPPNATFLVVDYHKKMNHGKGISKEQIEFLLKPFRENGDNDIRVIEGYEPGVFYVPVRSPETVYSFVWNTFCSFLFQSDLYTRYGVLITMASCPHTFLQKGAPYYPPQKEREGLPKHTTGRDEVERGDRLSGNDSSLENTSEDEEDPRMAFQDPFAPNAMEIDIFSTGAGEDLLGGLRNDPNLSDPLTFPQEGEYVLSDHKPEGSFYPTLVEDDAEAPPTTIAPVEPARVFPSPSFPDNTPVFQNPSFTISTFEAPPVPSWTPVEPALGGGILDSHTAPYSNNFYANNPIPPSTPNENYLFENVPPPSLSSPSITIYYEDLEKLVEDVEERIKHAFPSSVLPEKFETSWSTVDTGFIDSVTVLAKVPPHTVEITELFDVMDAEDYRLNYLMRCTVQEPKVQQLRDRLAKSLCIGLPLEKASEDWSFSLELKGASTEESEGGAFLPSLFPYLLQRKSELLRALLVLYCNPTTVTLLARYILPFLADIDTVERFVVPALKCAPTQSNPLLQRILKHGDPLARWFEEYINAVEKGEPVNVPLPDGASRRGYISHLGNTLDIFLSGLSQEQKHSCLSQWKEIPFVTDNMWETEDALRRTMLKLYLNSDLLDGTAVFQSIYGKHYALTSENMYFAVVTTLPTQCSSSLSYETARFCGCVLRQIGEKDNALGEKEAFQLAEACQKSLKTNFSLEALRSEYTAASSIEYQTKLLSLFAANTPDGGLLFSPPIPPPPKPLPVVMEKETSILGNGEKETEPSTAAAKTNQKPSYGKHIGESTPYPFIFWGHHLTQVMRHYPAHGTPFPALPEGWTHSISRSYGHYYFKPPHKSDGATYKHPVDYQEYMVCPQAFLKEAGSRLNYNDNNVTAVLDTANRKLSKALFDSDYFGGAFPKTTSISLEDFEAWCGDQRTRHYYLDAATLEALGVKYRTSEPAGKRPGHTTAPSDNTSHRSRNPLMSKLHSIHHNYPPKGDPFPYLRHGWDVDLDCSTGVYRFQLDRRDAPVLYLHPSTGRPYRVSTQEFARYYGLKVDEIARKAEKTPEQVVHWMSDQRTRDEAIDEAVVSMLLINYVPFEELPSTNDRKRSRDTHDEDHGRHISSGGNHYRSESSHHSRNRSRGGRQGRRR